MPETKISQTILLHCCMKLGTFDQLTMIAGGGKSPQYLTVTLKWPVNNWVRPAAQKVPFFVGTISEFFVVNLSWSPPTLSTLTSFVVASSTLFVLSADFSWQSLPYQVQKPMQDTEAQSHFKCTTHSTKGSLEKVLDLGVTLKESWTNDRLSDF